MKALRRHVSFRIFCFLIGLHVLNLSIGVSEEQSGSMAACTNFNDIESITELIAEQMLDCENAFPEHDEKDQSAQVIKTIKTQVFFQPQLSVSIAPVVFAAADVVVTSSFQEPFYSPFSPGIISPPPQLLS